MGMNPDPPLMPLKTEAYREGGKYDGAPWEAQPTRSLQGAKCECTPSPYRRKCTCGNLLLWGPWCLHKDTHSSSNDNQVFSPCFKQKAKVKASKIKQNWNKSTHPTIIQLQEKRESAERHLPFTAAKKKVSGAFPHSSFHNHQSNHLVTKFNDCCSSSWGILLYKRRLYFCRNKNRRWKLYQTTDKQLVCQKNR